MADRWQPIDVNLITPYHRQAGRAPGLFVPPKSRQFKAEDRADREHNQKYNGGGGIGKRGKYQNMTRGRSRGHGSARKRPRTKY